MHPQHGEYPNLVYWLGWPQIPAHMAWRRSRFHYRLGPHAPNGRVRVTHRMLPTMFMLFRIHVLRIHSILCQYDVHLRLGSLSCGLGLRNHQWHVLCGSIATVHVGTKLLDWCGLLVGRGRYFVHCVLIILGHLGLQIYQKCEIWNAARRRWKVHLHSLSSWPSQSLPPSTPYAATFSEFSSSHLDWRPIVHQPFLLTKRYISFSWLSPATESVSVRTPKLNLVSLLSALESAFRVLKRFI